MGRIKAILGCFFVIAMVGLRVGAAEQEEAVRLTVYLDRSNQLQMRVAMVWYERARESAIGTAEEADYPEIEWNLVDKSYLSPEEYQAELLSELEAGEGPDLILTSGDGTWDGEELMDKGYLADISDYQNPDPEAEYLKGVMESGKRDGKRYLLPLNAEVPVLFGLTEELERYGITAEGCGNLEEFLEKALRAQEESGKAVFEDEAALEWLLFYGSAADEEELERRGRLLNQIECVWTAEEAAESHTLGAYEALTEGKALLAGCGMRDSKRLILNLSMLGEKDVTVFSVPSWDGEARAMIAGAIGINRNCKNKEAAVRTLKIFECFAVATETVKYPVTLNGGRWDGLGTNCDALTGEDIYPRYVEQAVKPGLGSRSIRMLLSGVRDVIAGGVFPARRKTIPSVGGKKSSDSRTITVMYYGMWLGQEHPMIRWLTGAARACEEKGLHVELIDVGISDMLSYDFGLMERYGTPPDIILTPGTSLPIIEYADTSTCYADLSGPLREAGISGEHCVLWKGKTVGIPFAAAAYGVWRNGADCQTGEAKGIEDLVERILSQSGLTNQFGGGQRQEAAGQAEEENLPGAIWSGYALDKFGALQCMLYPFAEEKKLFEQVEDGTWRTDKEVWEEAAVKIRNLSEKYGVETVEDETALREVADGSRPFMLGTSSLKSRAGITEAENLRFTPLCGELSALLFCVSGKSGRKGEAVSFIQTALNHETYAECIQELGYLPVSGAGQDFGKLTAPFGEGILADASYLPGDERQSSMYQYWLRLWNTDQDARELAGEYPMYEWK